MNASSAMPPATRARNDRTPLNVGVSVSADKVPPDLQSQNGWNYTDDTNTVIEVYGEWCEQIKASGANRVNIVYGCPDINVR